MNHQEPVKKPVLLIFLSLVFFLQGIGVDLYVPSLPFILDYFHTTQHLVQLTVGVYMLGYGIGQIVLGVLSDVLGRRRIILGSALSYAIITFLSAVAPNVFILIVYRLLLGISIAGLGISSRAIISDCYTGRQVTHMMIYASTAWALGPVLGPFIGSYLQHYFHWQANFIFLNIYGVVVMLYAFWLIPETHLNLLPLNIREILKAIRKVILSPVVLIGGVISSLTYSILILFNTLGPFLIQRIMGYSVLDYGYIALLLGLSFFLGTLFNRFVVTVISAMQSTEVAIVAITILSIIMLLISFALRNNLYAVLLPTFFIFFFASMVIPNLFAKCLSVFPEIGGTANAVFGSLNATGTFVLSGLSSTMKFSSQTFLATIYMLIAIVCLCLFYSIKGRLTKAQK